MRYFQKKLIALAASAVFSLVYYPLRGFSFGLEAAVCASFTVMVFGNALRRHAADMTTGNGGNRVAGMLLFHALCLGALIMIFQIGDFLTQQLPYWMDMPVGAEQYGHPMPTGIQLLQTGAIALLAWIEVRWFARATTTTAPQEGPVEGKRVIWGGQAALERERLNRLRLP